jgi:hypothetical protein
MKLKWHSISIKNNSFQQLKKIQELLPIRASMPQTIEWLIEVGRKQIQQSEIKNGQNDNTSRN